MWQIFFKNYKKKIIKINIYNDLRSNEIVLAFHHDRVNIVNIRLWLILIDTISPKTRPWPIYFFQFSVLGPLPFIININDEDTNIVSIMFKFANDTKICGRAGNPDDIMELQEDINKLLSWQTSGKWISMLINALWCTSDTTICKATITCPINSFRQQIDSGIWESSSPKTSRGKNKRRKLQNGQQSIGVHCPEFQVQHQRTGPPIIQIPCSPTSRTVQFWSPHLRRDIDKIENIQRRATKMIPEIRNQSYHQRIQDLDLIRLVQRSLWGQLIEVFKYMNEFTTASATGLIDCDLITELETMEQNLL